MAPASATAKTFEISIGEFFFNPTTINIEPGDSVRWINQGALPHTSTSGQGCIPDAAWDSGLLGPGESFSRTFDQEGNFPYLCDVPLHCEQFDMRGMISVGGSPGLDDPIPDAISTGIVKVQLETVVEGLTAPNWGTYAPLDFGRLLIADQRGLCPCERHGDTLR